MDIRMAFVNLKGRKKNQPLYVNIYICMYVCIYVCMYAFRFEHTLASGFPQILNYNSDLVNKLDPLYR